MCYINVQTRRIWDSLFYLPSDGWALQSCLQVTPPLEELLWFRICWVCGTQTCCSEGKPFSCNWPNLLPHFPLCWRWQLVAVFLCSACLFCCCPHQGWHSCIPSLHPSLPYLLRPLSLVAMCVSLGGVQTSLPVSLLLLLLMPALVQPVPLSWNKIALLWLPNTGAPQAIFSVM
jgi:hypothetical protein